jgi:hypothetical protein
MWKVQYKSSNSSSAWSTLGSYSESAALGRAQAAADRYFMVRVVDPNGYVCWTS